MGRYDTYKDSNVLWIGEIPDTWNIVKFNHFVFLKHGYQFRDYDFTQTGLKIIKITQLKSNGELETEKVSYIDEERLENFENILINEGDILMALTGGTIGKIIKVKKVVEPLLQNYRVGNFFPSNDKLDKSYLFWILSSNYILSQIFFDQRETGQPNIGKENFGRMFLTLPKTIEEQTKIANYLDQKTTEIDQLISQKKTLLKHYAEEKTAIINQAVTKGLNPKIKLKDSGLDWLGEIPVHWEVKKLSYCFNNIGSGTTPKSTNQDYYFNGEFNWLQTGDLNNGKIKRTSKKITQKALDDYSTLRFYPKDGIVIAMYGATIGKMGLLHIKTATNQACCVLAEPNGVLSKFVFNWFLSMNKHIVSMGYGGGQPNINQEQIRTLKIQLPDIKEQTQIVKHIETETTKINTKVSNTKKLIELLKEYKTALISEVVTGKIKVN